MPKEAALQTPPPEFFATSAGSELAYLEEQMRLGGFLPSMAARLVEPGTPLATPDDVVAVYEHVLKPNHPGNGPRPRGEILSTAPKTLKDMCNEEPNRRAILSLAKLLDIRQDETYPARQIEAVTADPKDVVSYVRMAANYTGAVRPAVAEGALSRIEAARGVSFGDAIIWHFGTARPVPVLRADGTPNPEHAIALKLAPDFLAADLDSTEFENNVASARQAGYVEYDDSADEQVDRFRDIMRRNELGLFIPMHHATDPRRPRRFAIRSNVPGEVRAVADLAVLHQLLPGGLEHKQFIVGENGPYRTSLQLFLEQSAAENGAMYAAEPVVFGDEAGFTVEHRSADGTLLETIKTADRRPMSYLPEFLVIWKAARNARAK